MSAPLPKNEAARLAAIHRLKLLHTPPEQELESLVQQVATLLHVPVALITVVGEDRQWHLAKAGTDLDQIAREHSFCTHAVADGLPLVVEDATADPRFAENPYVAQSPHIRFYAGVPLRSPDGHALGALCAMDLKPRRLEEPEFRALRALALVVEEILSMRQRLLALDAQRLQQSFVEMAMHDLKNPLFVVMGVAALAKDAPEMLSEDPSLLNNLYDSAMQLNARMASVLDLMSVNAGRQMPLHPQPLDPATLALRVTEQLSRAAEQQGLSLRVVRSAGLSTLHADETLLERVLENLILNAVKYAADGGHVEVQLREQKGELVVTVRDYGATPPPAALRDQLFQPFQRGESTAQRGSLGLGLAFCKAAVEAHGGRIWIEDPQPGPGTAFCFALPLPQPDIAAATLAGGKLCVLGSA